MKTLRPMTCRVPSLHIDGMIPTALKILRRIAVLGATLSGVAPLPSCGTGEAAQLPVGFPAGYVSEGSVLTRGRLFHFNANERLSDERTI